MDTFLELGDVAWEKERLSEDIRRLLDEGADPNVYVSSDGVVISPLRIAVRIKDEELIRLLLKKGADPNHEGNVRLAHELVGAKRPDLFALLIDHGWKFNPNQFSGYMRYGESFPLSEAVCGLTPQTVLYLLQLGANPGLKDESGRTAFDYCREITPELYYYRKKEDVLRLKREIADILQKYGKTEDHAGVQSD